MSTLLYYEVSYQVQGWGLRLHTDAIADSQHGAEHQVKQKFPKAYDLQCQATGIAKQGDSKSIWVLK